MDDPKDWERYYARISRPQDMPWFHEGLDPDVEQALQSQGLTGGRALDVGTGPGNHAIELAGRGFEVTGIDLSASVLAGARTRADEAGVEAHFQVDDILDTRLAGPFDVILDRGCFHCLDAGSRPRYAANLARLLGPTGLFLLKTFSYLDGGEEGPHRFHPDELDAVFPPALERLALSHTVYRGSMPEDEVPKALFTIWRRDK